MSTLSQFAGGGIKSVQRGTTSVTTTSTVTISSVDTSKSVVIATVKSGTNRYVTVDAWWACTASTALTNSTTITLTNGAYSTSTHGTSDVAWQVVEYY
jgi:hypothetical protein